MSEIDDVIKSLREDRLEAINSSSHTAYVNGHELGTLLEWAEQVRRKVTTDVYIRGEWWNTIMKVDLTEDQVRLLDELGERSKDTSATIEVQEHDPAYPLPNWEGYTRK